MSDPNPSPLGTALARFERTLRNVGRRFRLRDGDFDELVQEVRIRLWRAEGRETGSAASASYLWKTAEAAAIDLFRRRRTRDHRGERLAAVGGGVAMGMVAGPERLLEESELADRVMEAVSQLPESRRVPVRMHLAGYKRHEIAEALNWTEPKTRNLIYRGLSDLRAMLLARGIGPEGTA